MLPHRGGRKRGSQPLERTKRHDVQRFDPKLIRFDLFVDLCDCFVDLFDPFVDLLCSSVDFCLKTCFVRLVTRMVIL